MSPEYRRAVAHSLAAMADLDSARRRLRRLLDEKAPALPLTPEQREALTNAEAQLTSVQSIVGSAFLQPPAEETSPAPAE